METKTIEPRAAWKRAWQRSWKTVVVVSLFGLACSTARDWILFGSAGLLLVSLAVWGARGKSAAAHWVADEQKWMYVVEAVGVALLMVWQALGMAPHERVRGLVSLLLLVAVLAAGLGVFVLISMVRSCTRDDRREQIALAARWTLGAVAVAVGVVWLSWRLKVW